MKDKIDQMKKELVDNSLKASLFVATPMYGGVCMGNYTVSLMNLPPVLHEKKIAMHYSYMTNESLITRARNNLVHGFLKSSCTHMMFIDADIGFNPADIPLMVEADVDIICGIYPKKLINWEDVKKAVNNGVPADELKKHTGNFVINLLDGKTSETGLIDKPLEVKNAGTGFMLIKREVFEKLSKTAPCYVFDTGTESQSSEFVKEFFTTCIEKENNQLLSEDYYFCKIAKEAGFKVYAAPWADLIHTGTYPFSGTLRK